MTEICHEKSKHTDQAIREWSCFLVPCGGEATLPSQQATELRNVQDLKGVMLRFTLVNAFPAKPVTCQVFWGILRGSVCRLFFFSPTTGRTKGTGHLASLSGFAPY